MQLDPTLTKDDAVPMSHPVTGMAGRGLLLGMLLGYPVSYWFQPDVLRATYGLRQYIGRVWSVLTDGELRPTVFIVVTICAAICTAGGAFLGASPTPAGNRGAIFQVAECH